MPALLFYTKTKNIVQTPFCFSCPKTNIVCNTLHISLNGNSTTSIHRLSPFSVRKMLHCLKLHNHPERCGPLVIAALDNKYCIIMHVSVYPLLFAFISRTHDNL